MAKTVLRWEMAGIIWIILAVIIGQFVSYRVLAAGEMCPPVQRYGLVRLAV